MLQKPADECGLTGIKLELKIVGVILKNPKLINLYKLIGFSVKLNVIWSSLDYLTLTLCRCSQVIHWNSLNHEQSNL